MTDLSLAQKQAYARAHNSTVELWAIELRHPTFGAPIRLVQFQSDIPITLEANAPVDGGTEQVFTGFAFEIKEPAVSTEPDSQISVRLDGVSGQVQPYLAVANQTAVPIEATLRPFAFDVVSQQVGELLGAIHLQVRHVSVAKTTASLLLGYTNSANRSFPAVIYTAESNPGLL